MRSALSFTCGVVVAAVLAAPSAAHAQARDRSEGTVLALEGNDLIVDLGSSKGAHAGLVVELWRPVRLKHPVTGRTLTDRFRIGRVQLTQVQGTLSLAQAQGDLLREPAAGDLVIATAPALAPESKAAPPLPPESAGAAKVAAAAAAAPNEAPRDPDAQSLAQLFSSLEGTIPEARSRAYALYLNAHPKSRFAGVLREEIEALRAAGAVARPSEPAYEHAETPLPRVRPNAPQPFAVELDRRFVGAVVHVRKKGVPGYTSLPMAAAGPGYWAATLPAREMATPGAEYFVEGVPETGKPVAMVGTAESPRPIEVDSVPLAGKSPGTLAQLSLQSEYASFNAKKQNDYLFQTEGTFGWRLRDVGLRAVRSGFGVFRGEGGTLRDLDDPNVGPREVGLTYGWVEVEAGFTEKYGLVGRPIVGLRERGVSGGAQAFFRIGSDLTTNLMFGGEALGGIGMRGIVQLAWRTVRRVPILLRTEVTNQPAGVGSDVGARAIAQIGYEIVPQLAVAARLSYQGRTINHSGPGAGLAVSYQW